MQTTHLQKLLRELGIAKDHILREEAEMEILSALADEPLSAKLIFYGGTALRLAYDCPRFSEDIDLLCVKPVDFIEFEHFILKLLTKHPAWRLKDVMDKRQTMFALISIDDEHLKHNFSIKIEAHKPTHPIEWKPELSLLKSPTSLVQPLLLVPSLAILKRLKENALHGRKKARDVFDLWYITQSLREEFIVPEHMPAYTKREFTNELKVFLPKSFYPIINQLYDKINR